ncbi:MAG: response regulator transcription factor [Flammeovirgaceae bacterium]
MPKVLVVDDEPNMRLDIKDNLEFESYEVELAEDGLQGLAKVRTEQYDLVVLDVMMPNMSGFDVCREMRKAGIQTPIIFLTAKGEEIDKVIGLELGADDYITKPFSLREFLARVKSVLRRTSSVQNTAEEATQKSSFITIGRLQVNFEQYEGIVGGARVKMSHKEFEILHDLHQHANQVVSRYDLLDRVWGYQSHPTTRTVDNFILRLRQKIEENSNDPKIILTVHGVGYKLISEK